MVAQASYGQNSSIAQKTYSSLGKKVSNAFQYSSNLSARKKIALGLGTVGAATVLAYALHNLTGFDPTETIKSLPGGDYLAGGVKSAHDSADSVYLGIRSAFGTGAEETAKAGTEAAATSGTVQALSPEQHEEVLRKLTGATTGDINFHMGAYGSLAGWDDRLDKLTDEQLVSWVNNAQNEKNVPDLVAQYMILEPEKQKLIMDNLWDEGARERITRLFEQYSSKLK